MRLKTILLVEDNLSDAQLALRVFERFGIQKNVYLVDDGRAALDYLFGTGSHANTDNFALPSLILLDLNLPVIDGISVLKELRSNETTKKIPVVILSSSVEERDIREAYDNYANSYLKKPVSLSEFVNTIQDVIKYWLELNILLH